MSYQEFDNVWNALEDSPEQAENMKLRSTLMMHLKDCIQDQGWSGKEAAQKLGLSQPRVSYLMTGRIDKFSLDALVSIATRAGLDVKMKVEAGGEPAA